MQQATEIIATDVIGAQPVLCIGRQSDLFEILIQVIVGRNVWPHDSYRVSEEHDDQTNQRQAVAEQSPQGITPQTSTTEFW